MKYWRGYLTAAILVFFTGGLVLFAEAHTQLIDMVYPYVTRMVQTFLAQWSSGTAVCLWQVWLVVLAAGVIASVILMILLRWNPIQWFGWILSIFSLLFLLHTGIYGLNYHAGPLADDIRLQSTPYTAQELEAATVYYRDKANELSVKMSRDGAGELVFPSFGELSAQAGDGFHTLTYEKFMPIFAGSTLPVKQLGWADLYSAMGIDGITVSLTGESAVNPQIPVIALPFIMCREMSHRMSIAREADADMAAFLACSVNSSPEFQYSGYFQAYLDCYDVLSGVDPQAASSVAAGMTPEMQQDLRSYRAFYSGSQDTTAANLANNVNSAYTQFAEGAKGNTAYATVCDLLVNWHIQEIILPTQTEEENKFDPLDENQVDLTGLIRGDWQ